MLDNVQYVCITSDIWSAKKGSFFGVTCHWIDEQFCGINLQTFSWNDRVAELLEEIHSKFNLNHNKIVATVTDNGCNLVKAFKEYRINLSDELMQNNSSEIDDENENNNDGDEHVENEFPSFITINTQKENSPKLLLPRHVRCASHTFNLIVTSDIKNAIDNHYILKNKHKTIMYKCSLLWNKAGRPKSANIIYEVLRHSLSYPRITRWNSYFDSVNQILKEKEKLNILFAKLFKENGIM